MDPMQTERAKAGPPGGGADTVARYLANLAAMYKRDPALAARIDALPFADLPALEFARDANPTLRVTADDGRPVYVHSRYRPIEEARKFVAAQLEAQSYVDSASCEASADDGPVDDVPGTVVHLNDETN